MKNRDLNIIEHMYKYAVQIQEAKDYFSDKNVGFNESFIFQNTIAMSLLQIGELTIHLSDEYKNENNEINWVGLKKFRNLCAHDYANLDLELVWVEANTFLPKFINFCNEQFKKVIQQYDDVYIADENEEDLEI